MISRNKKLTRHGNFRATHTVGVATTLCENRRNLRNPPCVPASPVPKRSRERFGICKLAHLRRGSALVGVRGVQPATTSIVPLDSADTTRTDRTERTPLKGGCPPCPCPVREWPLDNWTKWTNVQLVHCPPQGLRAKRSCVLRAPLLRSRLGCGSELAAKP